MAEGANVTLLFGWLFKTNILESLVQCWYTSLPTGLGRIERAKTTSEVKKVARWFRVLQALALFHNRRKIEPFTATQMI